MPRTPPARGRNTRTATVVVVSVAIALVLGLLLATRGTGSLAGSAPGDRRTTTAEAASGTAEALAMLAALQTVEGWSPEPYDRDGFGQRWADVDRNGCDTRNDILGRDLLDPVFKPGTRQCKVLAGTLVDPYDGRRVPFVSGRDTSVRVQIDHVVALSWAWHHGADSWTPQRRTAFANDPANLVAASEETNQAKSAFGPSEWLPDDPLLRCDYLQAWVEVLHAYDLGVNAPDREAARRALESC